MIVERLDHVNIVTDRLTENFDDLMDYAFTAQLEAELDKVAEGSLEWKKVLNDFYKDFKKKLEKAGQENGMRRNQPVTTDIPCPVRVLTPQPDEPVDVSEVVVSWRAAPGIYNPDTRRCNTARDVGLVGYQLIVEVVNEARGFARQLAVDLPPGQRQLHVPLGFLQQGAQLPGTELKLEVLAIEDSGNRTITEGEFEVEAGGGD